MLFEDLKVGQDFKFNCVLAGDNPTSDPTYRKAGEDFCVAVENPRIHGDVDPDYPVVPEPNTASVFVSLIDENGKVVSYFNGKEEEVQ